MATHVISFGRDFPPEIRCDHPVYCADPDCGAEWDEDEDAGTFYDMQDGKVFCTNSPNRCIEKANDRAYRREAASVIDSKLDEMVEELNEQARNYPNDADDYGHPLTMVDDFRLRAKLFGLGTDNGWRNDLMLSVDEFIDLRLAIETHLRMPTSETFTANLQQQLALLNGYLKRSAEGVAL